MGTRCERNCPPLPLGNAHHSNIPRKSNLKIRIYLVPLLTGLLLSALAQASQQTVNVTAIPRLNIADEPSHPYRGALIE